MYYLCVICVSLICFNVKNIILIVQHGALWKRFKLSEPPLCSNFNYIFLYIVYFAIMFTPQKYMC